MKKPFATLAATILGCALVFALSGCSSEDEANEILETDTGLTGGVAATVNGTDIEEDKVTRAINNMRLNYNYAEDEDWKEYLKGQNATPQSMRDQTLGTLVNQELILQFADQRGVTATDEEIQSYVDKMKENYTTPEKWDEARKEGGFETDDDYKEALHYSILQEKLLEGFEQETQLSDDALLVKAQESAATYSGAKKSSHILFALEDKETAEDVKSRILSGELAFEDAVQQYSTDEGSKENGGDVGWDRLNQFVTEYSEALTNLNAGEVTKDLVESKYGYHIIMVTDVFEAPETIESLDQVPSEILEEIRTTSSETDSQDAMEDWLREMKLSSEVTINPMPENVPYDVDMSGEYTQEEIDKINQEAADELAGKVADEEETLAAEGAADDAAAAEGDAAAAAEAEVAPEPETTEVEPEASEG